MAAKQKLGNLLIEAGLLTEDDLNKALRLQVGGNRRLGYLLIKMGFIREDQLHAILSRQFDLPIVDIETEYNNEVKKLLPRYLCHSYSALPLSFDSNNTLKTAMVDPSDAEAVSDIEKYTGKVVRPVLAPRSEINKGIRTNIPWSFKDILNAQSSMKFSWALAICTLILVVLISLQLYQDKQEELYGTVTRTPQAISYENLELIIGFSTDKKISLLGRGAHSAGYYSVTFNDINHLQNFIESNKSDFSKNQLRWISWVIGHVQKAKTR